MPLMPDVRGLLLQDAVAGLEAAGVLSPAALGYLGAWPITVRSYRNAADAGVVLTADSTLITADDTLITVDETDPNGPQPLPPGHVLAQSIQAGTQVPVNVLLILSIVQFPLGFSYP